MLAGPVHGGSIFHGVASFLPPQPDRVRSAHQAGSPGPTWLWGLPEMGHQQTLFLSAYLPFQANPRAEVELMLSLGKGWDLQMPPTQGNSAQIRSRSS